MRNFNFKGQAILYCDMQYIRKIKALLAPFHHGNFMDPGGHLRPKVRNSLTKDDGATGYVVHNKVNDYEENPDGTKNKTRITFDNGLYLNTVQSLASMFRLNGEDAAIGKKLTGLKLSSNPGSGQPDKPELKRMAPFTVKILKQATDLLTIHHIKGYACGFLLDGSFGFVLIFLD